MANAVKHLKMLVHFEILLTRASFCSMLTKFLDIHEKRLKSKPSAGILDIEIVTIKKKIKMKQSTF